MAADPKRSKRAVEEEDDEDDDEDFVPSEDEEIDEEDAEDEEEPDLPPSDPEVQGKYRAAGEIVNAAIQYLIPLCTPGKSVLSLCDAGDAFVTEHCAAVYTKAKAQGKGGEKMEKGLAFPTCISVNNIVGHFSPLADDKSVLVAGDVVKIDVGAHIDGYLALAAHTLVCDPQNAPVTGPKANVIAAAHAAAEIALTMLQPGKKASEVTEAFAKVAAAFHVNPVQGILSHQMKRFIIDGNRVIISKTEVDQRVDDFEFEPDEVFHIDIAMSTGEGKPKELEQRTTIFKRALDQNYNLKLRASRQFIAIVNTRFPWLPFTLRAIEDQKTARLGLVESLKHDLLSPYPVLVEKDGEFVAHFKFSAIIPPSGAAIKICGIPADTSRLQPDQKVDDAQIQTVMAAPKKSSKSAKKKARKAKKAAAAGPGAAAAAGAGAPAAAGEEDEGED